MKKFLVFVFIFISSICFAEEPINIKFIYLNGSNANSEKKKQEFTSGIFNVQSHIKKVFESNSCICSTFLKNGRYTIDSIPEVFFWGFESELDLEKVNRLLIKTSTISPFLAQHFRSSIVRNIHDIIWIQWLNNMRGVISKLHKRIIEVEKNGEKVVLLGHSAGAFVTYVYILNKVKSFNTDFLIPNLDNQITCSDAIISSGMALKLEDGSIIKNPDKEKLEKGYKELKYYTQTECIPDNSVLGVMNFGSPLPLFYPDRLDESKNNMYIYQKNLLDYINNNNLFFLTLNYADDSLSITAQKNYPKCNLNGGFIYTYMQEKSPATFVNAHHTYWKYPKSFAKMAKNCYIEALNNTR